MKPWYREDTKEWIIQLEHRIEDLDYYLTRTLEWCEQRGIWDDERVFELSILTCLWVCKMRSEEISQREIFEILGVSGWEGVEDCTYDLGEQLSGLDYEEMLSAVADRSSK